MGCLLFCTLLRPQGGAPQFGHMQLQGCASFGGGVMHANYPCFCQQEGPNATIRIDKRVLCHAKTALIQWYYSISCAAKWPQESTLCVRSSPHFRDGIWIVFSIPVVFARGTETAGAFFPVSLHPRHSCITPLLCALAPSSSASDATVNQSAPIPKRFPFEHSFNCRVFTYTSFPQSFFYRLAKLVLIS